MKRKLSMIFGLLVVVTACTACNNVSEDASIEDATSIVETEMTAEESAETEAPTTEAEETTTETEVTTEVTEKEENEETTIEADAEVSNNENNSDGSFSSDTSSADAPKFQTGLWEVIDGEEITGWYYFSDSMTECSYHDDAGQGGIAFDYEIAGNEYIFHMGSLDDNTMATVAFHDSQNAVITWDSGETTKIRFVENTRYEDFDTTEGRGDVIDDSMAVDSAE